MIEKTEINDLIQNATALHQQLKFSEAQDIYEHILTIEPDNFDALRLLGLLLAQTKKNTEAVEVLSKALKVNPDHVKSLSNLGIALKGLGRLDEALTSFDNALSLEPNFADAYINRGSLLQNMRRFDEALASIDKALFHGPAYPETYYNRGNILQNMGRLDEALVSFDKAISLKPDYEEAYHYIGNILLELNRFDDALASYDKAIKFKPDYADAFNNRGVALNKLKRFDDALASYDRALELKPNYLDAINNKSKILDELSRFEEAIVCYQRAIEIKPSLVLPHYNLSITNLRLGNFKQGWQEYGWRWKEEDYIGTELQTSKPSWDYKKTNKKLLVWCEQGIGDHIAFGTILADLLEITPNLSVQTDKRLITIFSRSLPKIKFYPKDIRVPEEEYEIHVPIADLGGCFRNKEEDFLNSRGGYLIDDEIKTIEIKKDLLELIPASHKICGISWKSSRAKNGSQRSIPLKDIIKTLDLKGYTFVSLQYGDTKKELKELKDELGINVISYSKVDNFNDIDGLASLIQACDIVISVVNVTCHIAGALGKNTYIIHSNKSWWGWMTNRTDSLWYSSIKLYRQRKLNDWRDVFKEIKIDLKIINK